MRKRWSGSGLLVFLAALTVAAGVALERPGSAMAADCSAIGVYASELEVGVAPPEYFPYDYWVRGWGYVSNPASKAGCYIRVCEAEELGAGNWVPAWCNTWVIQAGFYNYYSQAPYVDCQTYGGTGWFRSYVRMEASGVSLLGPPRRVC